MSAAASATRQTAPDGSANLSSSSLSPPLSSDESVVSPPRTTHPKTASNSENSTIVVNFGGGEKIGSPSSANTPNTTTTAANANAPAKIMPPAPAVRKTRKKTSETAANANNNLAPTDGRVAKSRSSSVKPRAPRKKAGEKAAEKAAAAAAAAAMAEASAQPKSTKTRTSKITDFVTGNQNAASPKPGPAEIPPVPTYQNGNADEEKNVIIKTTAPTPTPEPVSLPARVPSPPRIPTPVPVPPPAVKVDPVQPVQPVQQVQPVQPAQPVQPVRSSGQNYDPIRSATTENAPVRNTYNAAPKLSTPPPQPKSTNRASESPSISSLIDPQPTNVIGASHSLSKVMNMQSTEPKPIKKDVTSNPPTMEATLPTVPAAPAPPVSIRINPAPDVDMDRDQAPATTVTKAVVLAKKSAGGASTATSSAAASPKPHRQKEAPPPLPPGNGLLSSALFGGPTSAPTDGSENRAPTVILHIPMKGETNKYVNFARIAEEAYGWDALHPRLAAQRERLARVNAAGVALEKAAGLASADDMSVDLSGSESKTDMEGEPTKKKRKVRGDDYDKNDPFVDDSEMLWEEQAAASKDGFFVYSGPLIPEGEKAVIERANGTVKRGRGRGRGGSTRGGGAGRGASSAGAASTGTTRGGATLRKPRVTKASREKMAQEKLERERLAVLAAKPSTFPA